MSEQDRMAEAEFEAGFNGVSTGEDAPAPVAEVVPEETKPEEQVEPGQEPESRVEPEEVKAEKDDAPVLAGLTDAEIRNLLSRVAKVDELEAGLRKAHGTIGELKSHFKELKTKAPEVAKQPTEQLETSQVEEDYPDIAAWVRAQLEQKAPVEKNEPVEQAPEKAAPAESSADLQLALMDHLHEGWREKVQGRDFNLWLASQNDDVRTKYETASTAKELGGVLNQFDKWSVERESRTTNGKKRLEQALTPEGSAGKPKTAPSIEDEFNAGFKSVIGR